MQTVNYMFIFDVDGVITNPQEKRVTEPEILSHIVRKLELDEQVALNTGRSLAWMINRVINPLLEKVKEKKILQNFLCFGEKGGTWITFDENGKMQHHKDESISVPKSLQDKVRNLINSEFSESMFFDETKETMISTEMKDGYSVEEYRKNQGILSKKLKKLVENDNLNEQLKVDTTTIATDIENKHVGKGFALDRILKWLQQRKIKPKQFIAFGDSRGDIEMAEKLNLENLPFIFVFVGNRENLEDKKYPFPMTFTQNRFDKGTLEFLREH